MNKAGSHQSPRAKELKYLGVLFKSDRKVDCEADRLDAVKSELRWKARLSIYQTRLHLSCDQKKENREYNRGNKFPSVGWLGSEMECGAWTSERSRAAAPSR